MTQYWIYRMGRNGDLSKIGWITADNISKARTKAKNKKSAIESSPEDYVIIADGNINQVGTRTGVPDP